ncbi:MAG: STAS domain-containing protein [Gaiellaceae bacterium]
MPAQPISVSVVDDRATVALEGEHVSYTADRLARSLGGLIDEGVAIVIDLSHATFVDSTVMGVLIAATRRATERDLELTLLLGEETGWPVRRMLELTGLDGRFDVTVE